MIDECQVSRQVVRQAYNELVQSGVVVRERGRGTFVKARNYGVFLNKLLSYQEEITRSGKIPKTVVLQPAFLSGNILLHRPLAPRNRGKDSQAPSYLRPLSGS